MAIHNVKRITFDERGNLKEIEFFEGTHTEACNIAIEWIRNKLHIVNEWFPQQVKEQTKEAPIDG